tara:strand:+ start:88972 stop:90393 length:1422 start_codon:yes stop_codon:yes gene_type:complete
MNISDKEALRIHYATNIGAFCRRAVEELYPGRPYRDVPHIRAIIWELERVLTGETTRLVINVPPRHYKSTLVSVLLVAFLLGLDPTRKIMVVSYAGELAIELHNLTRDLMLTHFYAWVFPKTKIKKGKNTEIVFKTTKGGGRKAVTTGGSAMGFGADIIIGDDLMKPDEAMSEVRRKKINEYLDNTLLGRLDDKKDGTMIMVQQRLHPEDTTGYVLGKGGWKHLKLSALATTQESIQIGPNQFFQRQPGDPLDPEREDLETLAQLRSDVGEMVFAGQWLQEPTLPGGNVFKIEQFKRCSELPPLHHCEYYVQSWDPAVTASVTSDYSVCTTWLKQGDIYYLVDVFREKLEYVDLEKAVHALAIQYKPRLVIFEASHIGQALYSKFYKSELSKAYASGPTYFRAMNVSQDKVTRAAVQTVKIEQRRVVLPVKADWLDAFEAELRDFPAAKHDDQVDSMVQFLRAMDLPIAGVNI